MVILQKTHKRTVTIEGHPITVGIARLSREQASVFQRQLAEINSLTRRQQRELEDAKTLAPEALDEVERRHASEDLETDRWVRQVIEAYVTVVPGELSIDDHEILTG